MPDDARGRGSFDPMELWKPWIEATGQIFLAAAKAGAEPIAQSGEWLKLLDEARSRMLRDQASLADPWTALREWYEATNAIWSKAAEDILSNTAFVEATSRLFNNAMSQQMAQRRSAEQQAAALQLASKSDVARVAGLVVALEEKVERIEEALASAQEHVNTGTSPGTEHNLDERLERLERKLDALLASAEPRASTPPERPASRTHLAAVQPPSEPSAPARRRSRVKSRGHPSGTAS